MKKKRNTTPLLIIAFLVIGIALLFIFRSEGKKAENGNYPYATATPQPTATPEPGKSTSVPAGTASPEVTAAPTETPEPTPSPTPTASPTPTPTPSPTPVVSFSDSGEFRSDTGTYLNTIVRWEVSCPGDGNNTLHVKVYTESYALFNASRTKDICINVNGEKTYYDSPAISLDTKDLSESLLCDQTFDIGEEKTIELSVDWVFNGQYSKKEVGTITANGVIRIP